MGFNSKEYINKYQKDKYKMYQFRVKKDNVELINHLDNLKNRNSYIIELLSYRIDSKNSIYTLSMVKNIIKPILEKYGIKEVYLFGSYARGEARENSDIDIYCERGKIQSLIDLGKLQDELESALNKDVDIVLNTSDMNDYFRKNIEKDLIKLC